MYFINPNLYVIISPTGEKCGLNLLLRTLGIDTSSQVVSAPSGSVLPAWLRVAISLIY